MMIALIMARDGKLVIRPDSGDPVEIICGMNIPSYNDLTKSLDDFREDLEDNTIHGEQGFTIPNERIINVNNHYFKLTEDTEWNRYDKQYYFIENISIKATEINFNPNYKGVIELLWDEFGGTINEQGYKVLDSHIGAIYGDSITLDRQIQIYSRLAQKGFASTNIVLGVGSYTYQYNTRDTLGFAAKGAWFETKTSISHSFGQGWQFETKSYDIYKDPITDDGTKKSLKGLLQVNYDDNMNIVCLEQCTEEQESKGLLQVILEDGKYYNQTTLTEIRKKLN